MSDERERALLARLADKRFDLLMSGKGQVAMGVLIASEIVADWVRQPPTLMGPLVPDDEDTA